MGSARYLLRRVFNAWMRGLPRGLHTALLKGYAKQPELALASGFRVYPQSWMSPLVDPKEIDRGRLNARRNLPRIRIDMKRVEATVNRIAPDPRELADFPRQPGTGNVLWSETYPLLDTGALYGLLRHLKPKRYIEVGCGCSSRVSSMALRANEREGHPCEATFIEPYPGPRLEGVQLHGRLLVKKIEEVPLDDFASLGPGDVFFIDTSYVIKCQNDVEWELLHILPSLQPGVWIHIHDIFTPYDVPEEFILGPRDYRGATNEQYAVEALLSGGERYAVEIPCHLIGRERRDLAERLFPGSSDRGQAIWLQKVA